MVQAESTPVDLPEKVDLPENLVRHKLLLKPQHTPHLQVPMDRTESALVNLPEMLILSPHLTPRCLGQMVWPESIPVDLSERLDFQERLLRGKLLLNPEHTPHQKGQVDQMEQTKSSLVSLPEIPIHRCKVGQCVRVSAHEKRKLTPARYLQHPSRLHSLTTSTSPIQHLINMMH